MPATTRPRRSVLYMPGSRARALEKARSLPADALILDLEDAVAPAEKINARALVADATATGFGKREVIIRINGLETDWGLGDLVTACAAGPDAILVPKVNSAADLERIEKLMISNGAPDHTAIWAMMETPLGMLNAREIAFATPRLAAFVLGTNDLVKELQGAHTEQRLPVITSLGLAMLAARAAGIACLDGVYNAYQDNDGLREACLQGRAMGFDGKTLIHPAQLDVTNEVFAPSADDLTLAQAYVAAFDEAEAKGEAVAVVDGRIVENLHVENAKRLLSLAEAIAALDAP